LNYLFIIIYLLVINQPVRFKGEKAKYRPVVADVCRYIQLTDVPLGTGRLFVFLTTDPPIQRTVWKESGSFASR